MGELCTEYFGTASYAPRAELPSVQGYGTEVFSVLLHNTHFCLGTCNCRTALRLSMKGIIV